MWIGPCQTRVLPVQLFHACFIRHLIDARRHYELGNLQVHEVSCVLVVDAGEHEQIRCLRLNCLELVVLVSVHHHSCRVGSAHRRRILGGCRFLAGTLRNPHL